MFYTSCKTFSDIERVGKHSRGGVGAANHSVCRLT